MENEMEKEQFYLSCDEKKIKRTQPRAARSEMGVESLKLPHNCLLLSPTFKVLKYFIYECQ